MTFNDKDLLWLNDRVRLLIKRKNAIFQKYLKYGKTNANYTNLQASKSELTDAINVSKIKYFKRLDDKLNNPAIPHLGLAGQQAKILLIGKRLLLFLLY